MTNHTPGPWRPGNDGQSVVCDSLVGTHPVEGEHLEYYGGQVVAETVTAANMPLICAAPRLYAALVKALHDSGCDGDLCTHQWHEEARAAIAEVEEA